MNHFVEENKKSLFLKYESIKKYNYSDLAKKLKTEKYIVKPINKD
jgi:hypothetical protein